jgi:hypothetical protein
MLKSVLGLSLLWYVIFFLLRDHLIDAAREELFAARDELFNYATEIGMDYDDKRHTMLRGYINLTIRYIHKLTFLRMLLSQISRVRYPAMYRDDLGQWQASLDSLPAGQKERFTAIFVRAMRIAILQMVFRSWWLIPIAVIYKMASLVNTTMVALIRQHIYKKIRMGLYEQEVEEQGSRENCNRSSHPTLAHV